MLGSLPIPSAALVEAWPDPAWELQLRDAIVMASDADGTPRPGSVGLLRAADRKRGIGIVNLDGETEWLDTASVVIPHPVLIEDLDELRGFATDLGVVQTIDQLMRDVHPVPTDLDGTKTALDDFANATFKELRHATGRAATLGFRVRGGFAVCAAFDNGGRVEARYWIGADDPASEAWTGDLIWVDGDEKALALGRIGPVAYSEGVRMASLIHAARVVDDADDPAAR